jgi:hypothetical protein
MLMYSEQMIGDHPRFFGCGHVQYNPWHCVPALERKPGSTLPRHALQRPEFIGCDDASTNGSLGTSMASAVRELLLMVAFYSVAIIQACGFGRWDRFYSSHRRAALER